ncbi:heavy metal translocating P-type ATPase [Candidatus Mycoplasma pogonae]
MQKSINFLKKIYIFFQKPNVNLITLVILFLPFLALMIIMLIDHQIIEHQIPKWFFLILLVINTFVIFVVSINFFKNYKMAFKLSFNMDLLIALGAHITYFYSLIITIIKLTNNGLSGIGMEFWEVPIALITFVTLGHWLENRIMKNSSIGIGELLKLQNRYANLLEDGEIRQVLASKLVVGNIIVVKPGENIPVDGLIVKGKSEINTLFLTGETIPRVVENGSAVISGTQNLTGALEIEVTHTANDSTLRRIINKLETIVSSKTKIQRVSEKIVKLFIPTILLIAIFTFILWAVWINVYHQPLIPSIYHGPNLNQESAYAIAAWVAVSVIVIACPCAFGIAAPAAIYSASYVASKNKILFASADVYEKLNKVQYIIFDKTGTITEGKPQVKNYYGDSQYQKLAYELAFNSNHPFSQAIVNYQNFESPHNFEQQEVPGYGIIAQAGKDTYELAAYTKMLHNNYQDNVKLDTKKIVASFVAIAKNKVIEGVYEVSDAIKSDAYHFFKNVKARNIKTIMASGDNADVVEHVAKKLGINFYYGNVSPETKLEIVENFKAKGLTIFVGDGINDVLAIKSADLGIAYASGSDLVNNFADISLMENSLTALDNAIYIAQKTLKTIKMNFGWALIFNVLVIPLALLGAIMPWIGAILMILSNIILITNTIIFKSLLTHKIKNNKLEKSHK